MIVLYINLMHLSKWVLGGVPQADQRKLKEFGWRNSLSVRILTLPRAVAVRIPTQRSIFLQFVMSEWCQSDIEKSCCCQSPLYGQTYVRFYTGVSSHRHFQNFQTISKFGLCVDSIFYKFTAMVFWLNIAWRIFTKVMRVLVQRWRSMSIPIVIWFDDGLGISATRELNIKHALIVRKDLKIEVVL